MTNLPKLEGNGTANHLPRVRLEMTTRQLDLIQQALPRLMDPPTLRASSDRAAEIDALASALAIVAQHQQEAPPFVLADISIAPEVTFDD